MLPWGTPEWIWKLGDVSLLNFVTKWRPCRYDFSKLKYLVGRVFFILYSSPGCQTLSNVWLTSRKAAVQI